MLFSAFLPGFIFSFLGSIPPGSINLSVLELGLKHQMAAAFRFSLAAALVEIPYAYIAIEFASLINNTPGLEDNLQLWGAGIMIVLGIISLVTSKPVANKPVDQDSSGFKRGILISILNPLAIPFWIGLTAYLQAMNWLNIDGWQKKASYIFGISIGTFALLALIAVAAKGAANTLNNKHWLRFLPGVILITLGGYAIIDLLFQ